MPTRSIRRTSKRTVPSKTLGSRRRSPSRCSGIERRTMPSEKTPLDLESFWQYSDPAASEGRFRALLPTTEGDVALELRTQIARTYSLRRRFAEAHAILNEVEHELPGAGLRPRIRYVLERGRTFNSSGEKEKARALFVQAWEVSQRTPHEGLAVDAAHMVAITHSGTPEALAWNEKGLA